MFKIDDRIIWIEDSMCFMTKGKSYTVIDTNGDILYVYNDRNSFDFWHEKRFITDIKDQRKKKIKRCLRQEIK